MNTVVCLFSQVCDWFNDGECVCEVQVLLVLPLICPADTGPSSLQAALPRVLPGQPGQAESGSKEARRLLPTLLCLRSLLPSSIPALRHLLSYSCCPVGAIQCQLWAPQPLGSRSTFSLFVPPAQRRCSFRSLLIFGLPHHPVWLLSCIINSFDTFPLHKLLK